MTRTLRSWTHAENPWQSLLFSCNHRSSGCCWRFPTIRAWMVAEQRSFSTRPNWLVQTGKGVFLCELDEFSRTNHTHNVGSGILNKYDEFVVCVVFLWIPTSQTSCEFGSTHSIVVSRYFVAHAANSIVLPGTFKVIRIQVSLFVFLSRGTRHSSLWLLPGWVEKEYQTLLELEGVPGIPRQQLKHTRERLWNPLQRGTHKFNANLNEGTPLSCRALFLHSTGLVLWKLLEHHVSFQSCRCFSKNGPKPSRTI